MNEDMQTAPTVDELPVADNITDEREIRSPQPQHQQMSWRPRLLMLLIAVLVIVMDQFTKYLIESNLQMFEVFAPWPALEPYFRIMHVYNTGAAFGIFPQGSLFFAITALVVGGLILVYNFTMPGAHYALRVALGLQLGGAMGNFIDRLRIGHVTDFLDFGPWPLFNIADTAIVSGAVVLGVLMLRESRELKAQERIKQGEQENEATLAMPERADEWSA